MASDNLSLKMLISANGKQAMAEFLSVSKGIKAIPGTVSGTFGIVGYATNSMIIRPLKAATAVAAGLGAAMVALGTKSLLAAAADEKLENRMIAVYGSAQKGRKIFEELEAISRKSPFNTDDLAEAQMALRAFGMDSRKNLEIMGAAAKVADANIGDLTRQAMALQMRGLKQFGIEADTKDDTTVFRYRDRMGRIRNIIAKDSDAARKAVLSIFANRFGSNLGSGAFTGLFSNFKNSLEQAFAHLGGGMLGPGKNILQVGIDKVNQLIESGKLDEWGKKLGDTLRDWIDKFQAAFMTGKTIAEDLKKSYDDGGTGLGKIISAALQGGATFLWRSMLAVLGGMENVWVSIGQVIGAAMMEKVLATPMFGMQLITKGIASGKLKDMSEDEFKAYKKTLAERFHLAPIMNETRESIVKNPQWAGAIAAGNTDKLIRNAVESLINTPGGVMKQIGFYAGQYGATMDQTYNQVFGKKPSEMYAENLASVRADRAGRGWAEFGRQPNPQYGPLRSLGTGIFSGDMKWSQAAGMRSMYAQQSLAAAGGRRIEIGTVNIYSASSAEQIFNQIEAAARTGRPLMAAAAS